MKNTNKTNLIFITILALIILGGCAGPGQYVLNQGPTTDTKSFRNIEVTKVEVGITKDELDPETTIELRTAIIEQIEKKNIYNNIAAELDLAEGVLQIQPKIIEFDKGSQGGRWLAGGFGVGKAALDVYCKFVNKETGDVVAEGTFSGHIKGGFFGGSADQKLLSKHAAQRVAMFLKKGR